jgi:hypothetical protein
MQNIFIDIVTGNNIHVFKPIDIITFKNWKIIIKKSRKEDERIEKLFYCLPIVLKNERTSIDRYAKSPESKRMPNAL